MSKGRTLPIVLIFSIVLTVIAAFLFTTVPFLRNLVPFLKTETTNPISGQNVDLEYWGMYEPEPAMQLLISKYNETHPGVKITYLDRNFEGDLGRYKSTLLTRLKAGNGPQIFRAHSTWIPEYIREVSLENKSIKLEEFRERFFPVAETQCVLTDGRVVCVPLMYDGLVLFYNKELFSALGIGVPDTWDEVRDAALKLTQRDEEGNPTVAGIAIGTADNVSYSSDILGLMLLQSGVAIPEGLDTEKAAAAITFYTNFMTVDKVWNDTFPNSISAFASQRTAMAFGTSKDLLTILDLNPTLQIGVLPVPQLPDISGGTTSDTWASFWVESVSADATDAQQKAAWDFLEWLSQPEQQKMLYSETSKYKKLGTIPGNREAQVEVQKNAFLKNISSQALYSRTFIVADNAGNDEYSNIFKGIINKLLGKASLLDIEGGDPMKALQSGKEEYLELINTPR